MLHGLDGDTQLFRYLIIGHTVPFRHKEDFTAAVGKVIDYLPNLCLSLRAVYGFLVTDNTLKVGRIDSCHLWMLTTECVNTCIAHGGIKKSALIGYVALIGNIMLISVIMLPELYKTILYNILARHDVTVEIMGGIEAQRPIILFEKGINKHKS